MDQKTINVAQIAQEKNELRADLYEKALNTEIFPPEKLSPEWRKHTSKAIRCTTPLMQRISLFDFAMVLQASESADRLTLFQFGVLSNSLEAICPDALGLNYDEYFDFITEANSHILFYKEQVGKLQMDIHLKVDKEFQMKVAANGNGLSSVKGEA